VVIICYDVSVWYEIGSVGSLRNAVTVSDYYECALIANTHSARDLRHKPLSRSDGYEPPQQRNTTLSSVSTNCCSVAI